MDRKELRRAEEIELGWRVAQVLRLGEREGDIITRCHFAGYAV